MPIETMRIMILIFYLVLAAAFITPPQSHASNGSSEYDEDAKPIMRVPPVFPPQLQESGYCCLVFDVSQKGKAVNIKTNYCTNEILGMPSIQAVSKWIYEPATHGGQTVIRRSVRNTMRFHLSDASGRLIPNANGWLSVRNPDEDVPTSPSPFTPEAQSEWLNRYFHTEASCGLAIS